MGGPERPLPAGVRRPRSLRLERGLERDGQHALSGSEDQTVRLWEVRSGRCLRVLEGHTARVRSVAWSADGQHALSGSADKTVRLWEVQSGRCLQVLEGHTDSV